MKGTQRAAASGAIDDATPPVLNRTETRAICQRVLELISGTEARVEVWSGADGSSSFTRGDLYTTRDGVGRNVTLTVGFGGPTGMASTTRLDEVGLKALVETAEQAAREQRGPMEAMKVLEPQRYLESPKIWFQSVIEMMPPEARAEYCTMALDATDVAGVVGMGNLWAEQNAFGIMNTAGLFAYQCSTRSRLALTARTKDGKGSGAAFMVHEDWAQVDAKTLFTKAVDLAVRSAKPVALEPGRYTVILEPYVVAVMMMHLNFDAMAADEGQSPFSSDPLGTNKLGMKMFDERVKIMSDPWDPKHPFSTIGGDGQALDKVVWVEDGVLRNLAYGRTYARQKNRQPVYDPMGKRLDVRGPLQTFEEMIASTKRGVWVNHAAAGFPMNWRTALSSGTTRDGLFLIENGKITKAIKNFRFTESPIFMLNKIEAAGEPVRADWTTVVPRLKVRDFEFTSLTDAV